jgi:hypothetical protein
MQIQKFSRGCESLLADAPSGRCRPCRTVSNGFLSTKCRQMACGLHRRHHVLEVVLHHAGLLHVPGLLMVTTVSTLLISAMGEGDGEFALVLGHRLIVVRWSKIKPMMKFLFIYVEILDVASSFQFPRERIYYIYMDF